MLYGTVLGLGDSLTRGARGQRGWPELVGPMLTDEHNEWIGLNRGISGQTTWEILDRAPGAVREIASMSGPKWFVLLAGTNDSKRGGCDLATWEALYRQILHWPRRHGIPIALCTFPPVDPGRMPDFIGAADWLTKASARVRAIARELHNAPVPVRVVDLEGMPTSALCDGVHMTDDGYSEIARRVAAVLRRPDKRGRSFEVDPTTIDLDDEHPNDPEDEPEEDTPVEKDNEPEVRQ